LLLLDNGEHLLTAVAALAEALLPACPDLRVLVTSREALGVGGERLERVPPLALPERGPTPSPAGLQQYEAVQLFVDRAQLVQPAFSVTADNAAAVADVCRRLDGMPLAIELAAARTRAMPVEKLRERLDDIFRLLTGGSRTQLPRHQTLDATIAWSYDLLTETERTLFRRLSVFAGGWTLAAAEAVCADSGPPGTVGQLGPEAVGAVANPGLKIQHSEVLDLLTALVDKSLVQYEEQGGEARYRLLETVRQYALDRLLEAGEGEAVREQHGAFCLQLAEAARAAAGAGTGAEAFERLEPEHDNLRAAMAWFDGRTAARMLRLAGALGEFWVERRYGNEGRQWLERALAGTRCAAPPAERARALTAAGRLATHERDSSAARNRLEESIALYRRLGDTRGLVEALTHRSQALYLCEGNAAAARGVQEEAVARARALGDPRLLASALRMLGFVMGEHETARVVLEESLALARQVGDRRLVVLSLGRLGEILQKLGEEAKAREFLEESVELARAATMKVQLCNALFLLASVLSQQGDPDRAKPLREECLLLARELRSPLLVARAMTSRVSHDLSYEEALRMIDQAAREYGPGAVAIHPLTALGHRASERGDYEWAATCYRRSLALRQAVGDSDLMAQSLEELAGLAVRQQQWERAATLLGAVEGVRTAMGPPQGERAGTLWGAVEGVRIAMGRTAPAASPEEYARTVQGARAGLGEARFAAAWAEGRSMSLEEAITFASIEGQVA
jgi:non-specific serine/threonine protein kinase